MSGAEHQTRWQRAHNWLSILVARVGSGTASREQYYSQIFLTSQPDLNFHNEEVRAARLMWCGSGSIRGGPTGSSASTPSTFTFNDGATARQPAAGSQKELRNDTHQRRRSIPTNHQLHVYDKNQSGKI